MCRNAFLSILGISHYKLDECRNTVLNKTYNTYKDQGYNTRIATIFGSPDENSVNTNIKSPARLTMMTWWRIFRDKAADKMPDKDEVNGDHTK